MASWLVFISAYTDNSVLLQQSARIQLLAWSILNIIISRIELTLAKQGTHHSCFLCPIEAMSGMVSQVTRAYALNSLDVCECKASKQLKHFLMSLRQVFFRLQQPISCKVYTAPLSRPWRSLVGHNNIHSYWGICMHHVRSLCMFCNFIAATGESWISDSYMKTLREWSQTEGRDWHARLDSTSLAAIYFCCHAWKSSIRSCCDK